MFECSVEKDAPMLSLKAGKARRIVLFANTDWYLYNFRRSLSRSLAAEGYRLLLLSPPGVYGEKLKEEGFCWKPIAMDRRSINPIKEMLLIWRLLRLFRRERPVLIHGFTIKCAVYGSIAARLARVPARINAVAGMGYVFTSRSLLAHVLRPFVRVLMRVSLGGRNARLVLQNPDDVAVFERAGIISPSSIRLIRGSGVDCRKFVPGDKRESGLPVKVLLPARILWDKGVAEFVEAARKLKHQNCNAEFLLAGEPDAGNPAAVSRDILNQWVKDGWINWLGHVEDMPALFQSADVVALPSYREGLPKGLIEAAACGCALVTTDVPGCREVVSHEIDGLIVPAKDAEALAGAIRRLCDDPELRRKLGAAARQKALREFDERIVIEKTLAVYEELLQGDGPRVCRT